MPTCLPKGATPNGISSTMDGSPWSGNLWSSNNDPIDLAVKATAPELYSSISSERTLNLQRCGRYVLPAGMFDADLTKAKKPFLPASAGPPAVVSEIFTMTNQVSIIVPKSASGRVSVDLSNITASALHNYSLVKESLAGLEFPASLLTSVTPAFTVPTNIAPIVKVSNRSEFPSYITLGSAFTTSGILNGTSFESVSRSIGVRVRESLTLRYDAFGNQWVIVARESVHA